MSSISRNKEQIVEDLILTSKQASLARTRKYYYYTIIPILVGILWLIFSFLQVRNLNSQISNLRSDLGAYRDSVAKEERNFELLKYLKDSLQVQYLRYLQDNMSNNHIDYLQLEQSMKANSYLQNQLRNIPLTKSLNIWYFQKSLDAERVRLALKELGYENIIVTPTSVSNLDLYNGETNAIAIGADVPLIDVKVIALALIRTGFKLRYIYYSQRNSSITNLIQIVRTVVRQNGVTVIQPAMTVERIINASNINELIVR